MVILAGNHIDVQHRRPGVEWSHSAQDCIRVVRDYIKWDDNPVSLQHFAESLTRAYKIAMTPPMGPVALVLDGHLQEMEVGEQSLMMPAMTPTQPPSGDWGRHSGSGRVAGGGREPGDRRRPDGPRSAGR